MPADEVKRNRPTDGFAVQRMEGRDESKRGEGNSGGSFLIHTFDTCDVHKGGKNGGAEEYDDPKNFVVPAGKLIILGGQYTG